VTRATCGGFLFVPAKRACLGERRDLSHASLEMKVFCMICELC
jgi:hypothetical protein